MIVHRLMWPVLGRRFQDPGVPAWFHARVQARLLQESRTRTVGKLAMASALVMVVLIGWFIYRPLTSSGSLRYSLLFAICMSVWAQSKAHVQEIRNMVRSGRTTYAQAVEHEQATLSGHERMEYERCMRISA